MEDIDRRFSASLKQLLQTEKVFSQVEVSKAVDVGQSTISSVINGTRKFPAKKRDALFKLFGMTEKQFLDYPKKRARELSTTQDPEPAGTIKIKYLPNIQASAGNGVVNYDESVSAMVFEKEFLVTHFGRRTFRDIHIISAVGDSMEPGIMAGDLLFINPGETDLISGGIFCVWVSGHVLVKRISYDPISKRVRLLSDNDKYEPINLEDYEDKESFKVIGKLMGVFKKV